MCNFAVAAADFGKAATVYSQYLELCPEDGAVRFRLADAFDKANGSGGVTARAIELYQAAIGSKGLDPEMQIQARRRLTELLIQSGSFDAAKTEAEKLCGKDKPEADNEGGVAKTTEEWRGDCGPCAGREVWRWPPAGR